MASSDVGNPGGAHGKERPQDAEGFQLRHTGWRLPLKHAKCGNVQTKNNQIFMSMATSVQSPPELLLRSCFQPHTSVCNCSSACVVLNNPDL